MRRPKPHLVHAATTEAGAFGARVCGDTTEYAYVDDEYFSSLPPCRKCFPNAQEKTWGEEYRRRVGSVQAPTIQVKPILTLRSYLA